MLAGMCAGHVCGACVRGMCAGHVCAVVCGRLQTYAETLISLPIVVVEADGGDVYRHACRHT